MRTGDELVTIVQASMRKDDPRTDVRDDLRRIFRLDADAVGFTEASRDPVRGTIEELAAAYGYHYVDSRGGAKIAVHGRHRMISEHAIRVLDAYDSPSGRGNYDARDVLLATFATPAGNRVTLAEWHGITAYGRGNDVRDEKHEDQTRAVIRAVRRAAEGDGIAFFAGDTNEPDTADNDGSSAYDRHAPDYLFRRHGLVTVWDELDRYPDTHGGDPGRPGGGTIDVVGSFDGDRRVRAVDVKLLDGEAKDHDSVVATYRIRARRRP
jgi:hypothetical protein